MATTLEIAHRWANKDFGKNGTLTGSSTHCDDKSFYSYSTAIGQWLDKDKNLMAVIDDNMSHTTNRHISDLLRAIPGDVTVLRYHFHSNWEAWSSVDTLGYNGSFGEYERMYLIRHFLYEQYFEFEKVVYENKLSSGEFDMKNWRQVLLLNDMYHDCSPQKYLRKIVRDTMQSEDVVNKTRKMVRSLLAGDKPIQVVDKVFGKGTYQSYLDRTKGIRKRQKTREFVEKANTYLSHGRERWSRRLSLSYKEIKALSGAEIMGYKFAAILYDSPEQEQIRHHSQLAQHRAKKFLGIINNGWNTTDIVVETEDGEIRLNNDVYVSFLPKLIFDYESFVSAPDKRLWRKQFHKKAALIAKIKHGQEIERKGGLTEESSQEDIDAYRAYKIRADKYEANEAAKLAIRTEEEKRKEALVESYKQRGLEGIRDIWRDHIKDSILYEFSAIPDFYYGGNVLIRPNKNGAETSKGIKLSLKQCKEYWRVINFWHNHPDKFAPQRVETDNCGTFVISKYKDDLLTAGCHTIAYCEMERAAKTLNL